MQLIHKIIGNNRIVLNHDIYKKIFLGNSPQANSGILKTKKNFIKLFFSMFSVKEGKKHFNIKSGRYLEFSDFCSDELKFTSKESDAFLIELCKLGILNKEGENYGLDNNFDEDNFSSVIDILFYKSMKIDGHKTIQEKTWEKYAQNSFIFLGSLYSLEQIHYNNLKLFYKRHQILESEGLKASSIKVSLVDGNSIDVLYFNGNRDRIKVIYSSKTLKEVLEETNGKEIDLLSLNVNEIKDLEKGFSKKIFDTIDYEESIILLDEGYYDKNIRSIEFEGEKTISVIGEIISLGFNQFKSNVEGMSFIVISLEEDLEKVKKMIELKLKFSKESLYTKFPLKEKDYRIQTYDTAQISNFFFEKNAILVKDDGEITSFIKTGESLTKNHKDIISNILKDSIEESLGVNSFETKFGKLLFAGSEKEFLKDFEGNTFKIETGEKEEKQTNNSDTREIKEKVLEETSEIVLIDDKRKTIEEQALDFDFGSLFNGEKAEKASLNTSDLLDNL